MILKVGEILSGPEWIPMREPAEGECPRCGWEGPHPAWENEDGDMQGRCQECYTMFTVTREEETDEQRQQQPERPQPDAGT